MHPYIVYVNIRQYVDPCLFGSPTCTTHECHLQANSCEVPYTHITTVEVLDAKGAALPVNIAAGGEPISVTFELNQDVNAVSGGRRSVVGSTPACRGGAPRRRRW